MARKNLRKGLRPVAVAPGKVGSRTGLDRMSCGWRDAVGPGYVTGVTDGVTRIVSSLNSGRYCR